MNLFIILAGLPIILWLISLKKVEKGVEEETREEERLLEVVIARGEARFGLARLSSN